MSRSSILILVGVLVMLTPFSGMPISIRNLVLVVFGATILGIGLSVRTEKTRPPEPPAPSSNVPPV